MQSAPDPFELRSHRLGSMPVVNHFFDRLGLAGLLDRHLPADDARLRLPPATAIGVVVRNLVVRREPVYKLGEWAGAYDERLLGLDEGEAALLNDDRVGRMLARLFAADRATLITELVLGVVERFGIDLSRFHNDSTTVTFSGAYPAATGRVRAGKRTSRITRGHNKDHRPDLKQLLWVLTVSADGAVPVCYRVEDGNTADDTTHIGTWQTLRALRGDVDFLYVADSKLCTRPNMRHIDGSGGRFLTVLPRSRAEDRILRDMMHDSPIRMLEVARRPARRLADQDDVWHAAESPIPSAEGYRIVLVHSTAKAQRDSDTRLERINRAYKRLDALNAKLAGPKCRTRTLEAAETAAAAALGNAERWLHVTVTETAEESYTQDGPGRPADSTRYRRSTRPRFTLTWKAREDVIARDSASDGCYPLITNDRALTPAELLAAYKYQPHLERRHAQLKGPQLVAPVYLKNEARIEGLLCCHFIALLIQAIIERQLRNAMADHQITDLPIYPEDRACTSPSAARTLELFEHLTRHDLHDQHGHHIQTFHPTLNPTQQQILELLDIPTTAYTPTD